MSGEEALQYARFRKDEEGILTSETSATSYDCFTK